MSDVLEARDLYATAFDRHRRDTAGAEPAWLQALRQRAIDRFLALGFPTTHDEEWRFTSVAPIASRPFEPADTVAVDLPEDACASFVAAVRGPRLVFVNGRFAPRLSRTPGLPADTEIGTLDAALARDASLLEHQLGRLATFDDRAFTALNTGLMRDGAFVRIPAGTVLEDPVQLLFLSAPGATPFVTHPRVLVLAGAQSQCRVVESYASTGPGIHFTNAVTEIVLGEQAVVDHYKINYESIEAFHVGSMHVQLARSANFSSHAITFGGRLVRNEALVVLDGEGDECTLNGLYLVDGERLVDNHTTIDHARAHGNSHEVYKGVLDGRGRGVFNGKIIVRQDAQKTDAKQTNKALLLSEHGQINTKPQLEIFADDVRCTHGATVGQLDADQLFYLRARGIGRSHARRMLIHAFAGDVLMQVRIPELRAMLEATLSAKLPDEVRA